MAASDAYLRATMTERADIMGRRLFEVFPDNPQYPGADGVRNLSASLARVKENLRSDVMAAQFYPIRRPTEAGGGFEDRWWSPINSPVLGPHGELTYIIHRVEDVTAFVQAHEAQGQLTEGMQVLETRTQQMEADIVMRARELQLVNEQLRKSEERLRQNAADLSEANRRKTEFLAMLAHELRNPLAPITNALQIIRKTVGNAPAVASVTDIMERQVDHMVKLVDDLLDVNRISQGKIDLRRERIDVTTVVCDAVETVRPLSERRAQDLTVSLPPEPIFLDADPLRLAQVLVNLLNNAIKFTEKGGRIQLTVERQGRLAQISVRDSGIGLAPDQLPLVFDMFMQVNASLERTAGGLGIGLTLVKSLVEMHGGTVEARSAGMGHGSEFVVRIPIAIEESASQRTDSSIRATRSAGVRRVLIVDDNDDAARSMSMLLTLDGIETLTAHDGIEAVDAAATFRPDLVLLDIGLPRLNGYDVARQLRQQSRGKTMVLVALTGWGQEEDRAKSRSAGFDGHMVKPLDPDALMKLLAEFPSVHSIL